MSKTWPVEFRANGELQTDVKLASDGGLSSTVRLTDKQIETVTELIETFNKWNVKE